MFVQGARQHPAEAAPQQAACMKKQQKADDPQQMVIAQDVKLPVSHCIHAHEIDCFLTNQNANIKCQLVFGCSHRL